MPPITDNAIYDLTALPPPGGILLDAWATPPDWGDWHQPTKISLVTGGGPGEAFVTIEQTPDARVYLGEEEVRRAIAALSLALTAMRGFGPLADDDDNPEN